jgi:hypothetical protein
MTGLTSDMCHVSPTTRCCNITQQRGQLDEVCSFVLFMQLAVRTGEPSKLLPDRAVAQLVHPPVPHDPWVRRRAVAVAVLCGFPGEGPRTGLHVNVRGFDA